MSLQTPIAIAAKELAYKITKEDYFGIDCPGDDCYYYQRAIVCHFLTTLCSTTKLDTDCLACIANKPRVRSYTSISTSTDCSGAIISVNLHEVTCGASSISIDDETDITIIL